MRTRKLWNKKHGGLSQWGLSNRPRIRLGTVKSLNAPWELLALRRDYAKKIDPCRMLVWLGRGTVQNMVIRVVTRRIGSGQYTLLSGRLVQTGQVLFEFKLLRPRVRRRMILDCLMKIRHSSCIVYTNLFYLIGLSKLQVKLFACCTKHSVLL